MGTPKGTGNREDRDGCPVCGHLIEEVTKGRNNYCCDTVPYHGPFTPEELIGEDEDYAWVL